MVLGTSNCFFLDEQSRILTSRTTIKRKLCSHGSRMFKVPNEHVLWDSYEFRKHDQDFIDMFSSLSKKHVDLANKNV